MLQMKSYLSYSIPRRILINAILISLKLQILIIQASFSYR